MDKLSRMMIFCLLLAAMSSPVFTDAWKAKVVSELDALVGSCVVVPCSFSHPEENLPSSRIRGIWHRSNDRNQRVYYEDATQILENFRGRTRMLGHLGQSNCTLEMMDIKDHDNGPFCFRIELARTETDLSTVDKFSFVEDCVTLRMLPDPPNPTLTHPKDAIQDVPYTITCSVTHTCPTHLPKLTWSRVSKGDVVTEVHKAVRFGYWEAQSILTFTPGEKDDHSEVTCSAKYNGRSSSSTTMTLYVKRIDNYNHIIIPIVVVIVIAVVSAVSGILIVKRFKKRIAELQSGDGSVWNRLSRLSRRIRSDVSGPSRSDQRNKNVHSKSGADQKVSKPRLPSPKSQPKSYNYQEDLDDANVYGNI